MIRPQRGFATPRRPLAIGRILRVELRRSNARWMLLLLLPSVFTFGGAGRGLSVLALDRRQGLIAAFPLIMGVAAWHARRDRRSRMDELLATTARPRWQRVLPAAAALAIGVLAANLLAVTVDFGLAVAAGGYLSASAVPILAVGALALLVPMAFGLAVGRWLRFVLVLPLLVAYLPLYLFFGDIEAWTEGPDATGDPPGWPLLWEELQPVGTPFEMTAVAARAHLGQSVWALALVAAGLIVFATTRPRTRATAVVAVVAGAAVAVPVLPDRYADAYYLDPGATAQVCTPDAPRICVTRAHRPALADLRGPAREALAILAAKLPDAPTSVVEVADPFGSEPPPPRRDTIHFVLWVGNDSREDRSPADLKWALLAGAGTFGCPDPEPGFTPERRRYDIARVVAAAWLLDREPPAPADPNDPGLLRRDETLPPYRALRELPPQEQRDRVAALREAELACTGTDRLDVLIGQR
jgi:hypothetical protein